MEQVGLAKKRQFGPSSEKCMPARPASGRPRKYRAYELNDTRVSLGEILIENSSELKAFGELTVT